MKRQPPPPPSPSAIGPQGNLKQPSATNDQLEFTRSKSSIEEFGQRFFPHSRHYSSPINASPEFASKENNTQGRAKSSIRMRAPDMRRPLDHQRPRPISTGRLKSSANPNVYLSKPLVGPHEPNYTSKIHEGAQMVTRAILGSQERRDKSQPSPRPAMTHIPGYANWNHPEIQKPPTKQLSSPKALSRTIGTEEKASFKLKEAESRIGSLLQELDELRFFHEIDLAPSDVSPTKSIAAVPQSNSFPIKTKFLSPRRLASLDRTDLELEAQELQRQVEILLKEKSNLQAQVRIQEQQAQSNAEDSTKIQSLENALHEIKSTLIEQMQEIQCSRETMIKDYELKLQAIQKKYKKSQEDTDVLVDEVEAQKEKADRLEIALAHQKQKNKEEMEELRRLSSEKAKTLESMVDENAKELHSMTLTVENREKEMVRLQKELTTTILELEKCRRDLMESTMENASTLEKTIQDYDTQYKIMIADLESAKKEANDKSDQLKTLEESRKLEKERMEQLESQLLDIESKHKNEVETIKKSFDQREQRRLDELVQSQRKKQIEYEERLVDTRKQLKLATDRYQNEIEQKEKEMKGKLEQAVYEAKNVVRSEYESNLAALRNELEALEERYDSAVQENLRQQLHVVGKDRENARDLERRDVLLQGEIDRLNDKLDVALRDLAERDARLQNLTKRLTESEKRCEVLLQDLEAQNSEELKAREECMSQRKAVARLKTEIARKDFDIAEIREESERSTQSLQNQLDQAKKDRSESILKDRSFEDEQKNKFATLTQALEKAQKSLVSEQARHESLISELRVEVAKYQGKLSATESTLKEKRLLIEDLESKLHSAEEQSTSAGGRLHASLSFLKRELDTSKESLAQEESKVQEKDLEIKELRQTLSETNSSKDSKIIGLESTLKIYQQKFAELDRESAKYSDELERMREQLVLKEDALSIVSLDKEKLAEQLVNIQESVNTCELKINDLQRLLSEKEKEARDLENMIESLKETISNTSKEEQKLNMCIKNMKDEHQGAILSKDDEIMSQKVLIKEKDEKIQKLSIYMQQAIEESVSHATAVSDCQQRIDELEKQLKEARCSAVSPGSNQASAELQEELHRKERMIHDMRKQMSNISKERMEAINALEQLIDEVQLRQEEFDELARILDKREEELENAKLIATKALASAQNIKQKYKHRGYVESDKQADLQLKVDELIAEVEYLTQKSNEWRLKSTRLETELQKRNVQFSQMREELREQETKSTHSSSTPSLDKDGFLAVDGANSIGGKENDSIDAKILKKNFVLMETGTPRYHNGTISQESSPSSTSRSENMDDLGSACKWLQDFDDGKIIFGEGTESDVSPRSNRSVEREKVRNYVRKRFLKRTGSQDNKATI
jgi:chromosome segregation ATPase